ncbi:hypothetical protein CDEST_12005 [Colletotrichum destructivum]|uniref:Membrane-associated protein n=1 Tax=Colletotrichum destructivum TaxID=34406 RepID=A0AAX4IV30_9PEZI|nr:hypothetical protein CDEST_12005 [Colletotrichum destructivum]
MGSAPRLGALGHTFTAMRAMQFASLVAIIGMVSNFISEINAADATSPPVLVGTLVIVSPRNLRIVSMFFNTNNALPQACVATLYITITYILYYDNMLPLLLATAADSALLVAVIVVACLLGKPLSYLECAALPRSGSTAHFMASVTANINTGSAGVLSYLVWVGADQRTCYAIKAVWGLSIALCVLFAFSAITAVCLAAAAGGATYASSFPPPPTREVRGYCYSGRKSLGTTAVLAREKRWDSSSGDSGSDSDDVAVAAPRPSSRAGARPWFPPPPTTAQVQHKRVRVVEQRIPVHPLPVLPEVVVASPAGPASPGSDHQTTTTPTTPAGDDRLTGRPLARGKSKRKTIMEFIDGWWDLGLLEQQRQTMLARAASRK